MVCLHPASAVTTGATPSSPPGTTTIHVRPRTTAPTSASKWPAPSPSQLGSAARAVPARSSATSLSTSRTGQQLDRGGVKFRSSTAGTSPASGSTRRQTTQDPHRLAVVRRRHQPRQRRVHRGEQHRWQDVTFTAPVAIAANTTYVASYHAPKGHYADGNGFTYASVDNPPLSALKDDENGPNGPNASTRWAARQPSRPRRPARRTTWSMCCSPRRSARTPRRPRS